MFGWWAEWKRRKREKWEISQLSDEQKEKYFLKNKNPEDEVGELQDKVKKLETKFDLLRQIVTENRSDKRGWRVIQTRGGETEWLRKDEPKYVSHIYTTGLENTFYFDAIINGQKITFSEKTKEDAEERKLKLLDVERIEEYDETTQEEVFRKE